MRFSTILVSAGALLAGCGGSSNSGATAAPVPQDQFPVRFESAICDNIGSCCKSAGYTYDPVGCKTALQGLLGTIFNSSGTYDASAAGQCVQSVAHAMKSCGGLESPGASACDRVYAGTKAAGEPCTSSTECAPVSGSEVSCSFAGTAGSGQTVCTLAPRGTPGDGCNATCTEIGTKTSCGGGVSTGGSGGASSGTAICYTNDGVYCADNGVCAPLVATGQPCTGGGCVAGAYCESGTCTAKLGAGSSCTSLDACQDGTYCAFNTTGGTCTNLKAVGVVCASSGECASGHCRSGVCSANDVSPELCSGQVPQPGTGGIGGAGSGGASGGSFNGTGGA